MIYLNKGQENTIYLNINNNTRSVAEYYTLVFTHVMSKKEKEYTIPTNDPNLYFSNNRYCTITLDLATDDLIYEGQYNLNIYGFLNNELLKVYNGYAILDGTVEANPFTEYISPNEINENYIYLT